MPQISDEETPLLRDTSQNALRTSSTRQKTPLPWRQFSILLLLQVADPITERVPGPFLPQLIKDIGVTDGKDSRVGYYVGLLHSLFYLTEACTIFHWSRLSDKIGRKPVLLIGLFGLSLSMWGFGLSKTFWSLVISRCLCGALNGNTGVMKSMIIEITDSTNIAQAYSIVPMTWAFGMTVGPAIGGYLARPAEQFPKLFGDSEFLKEYPYFLPCAVPATITLLSWLIAFMFLVETKKFPIPLREYLFGVTTKAYRPKLGRPGRGVLPDDGPVADKQLPFRALLTRRVVTAAASYAMLSLIDMAFRALIPVVYSMPIEIGGLDLSPLAIGTILGLSGLSCSIIQLIFFASMYGRLGAKATFLISVALCTLATVMFPVMNAAARVYGLGYFVWLLVGFQMFLLTFTYFAYGVVFIYIGAAAPNKESIGATSGLAQIMVSVMRAVGPVVVNSAFSLSIEKNILGGYLAYWVMVGMIGLTLWVGYLLPKNV